MGLNGKPIKTGFDSKKAFQENLDQGRIACPGAQPRNVQRRYVLFGVVERRRKRILRMRFLRQVLLHCLERQVRPTGADFRQGIKVS